MGKGRIIINFFIPKVFITFAVTRNIDDYGTEKNLPAYGSLCKK